MPISVDDFAGSGETPAARSAGYDDRRPFLFDDLVPRFATRIVRAEQVAMRDGIRLSTDFHIPLGATLPLPVVLVRTPYNKRQFKNALAELLPEQGFVYAVQDVRGRHESEGRFVACSADDRQDGWDTIEWLSKQPWCNGHVGMIGASYTGETATKAAATLHPALKACIVQFDGGYAGGSSLNGAYLQGGVTMLRMMFGWFRDWVPGVSYGPPAHVDRETWFASPWSQNYATQPVAQPPVDLDAHLRTLPVHDLLDRAGAAPSEFGEMMRRAANPADPYWAAQGFLTDDDRFDVPTLHVTGPLERGGSGFDNFRLFRENAQSPAARDNQKLLFTPAPHSQIHLSDAQTMFGIRDLGDTRFPYYRAYLQWFGRWLRGDESGVEHWPAVRYYSVNRNAWDAAGAWPPGDVVRRPLYLAQDHALQWQAGAAASETYTYDPADPTPSEPAGAALDLLGVGYFDRSAIEARDDVIVFTTAVLDAALEIAGPVSVELFVSSSAPDTDFVATLVDVQPDNMPINVTHGVARMRYRDGIDRAVPMQPGTVYRITIDLWHAAITFPAGHRIRLEIASSSFPAWDRNLNTGGDNYTDTQWRVADNTVHFGAATPSALVLPVRPGTPAP